MLSDRRLSSIEPVQPRESSIPGVPERRIRISYETMDRWAQERKRLEAERDAWREEAELLALALLKADPGSLTLEDSDG